MKPLLNVNEVEQWQNWELDLMSSQIRLLAEEKNMNTLQMQKTAQRAIEGLQDDSREAMKIIKLILNSTAH